MRSKQFGGRLTNEHKSIYQQSENWQNGVFKNIEETPSAIDWKKIPGMICKQIKGHKYGYPKSPLPVQSFDTETFLVPSEATKFIWFGHSVLLLRMKSKTILIDPMLGDDASPIAPRKTKRFSNDTIAICDLLPDIDLMVLTHDHYDHLDHASIQKLKDKTSSYYVDMGLKRHLVAWGIDPNSITEFDWWDNTRYEDIHITFTPTRHFSGRGVTSIAKCLWGGWVFKTDEENIWFSGDGGYGTHFKTIGERLGPFDFAFMECGQYGKDWPLIHLFPEESVKAALEAGAKKVMPVHWGGFNLSYQHAWFEPVEAFIAHCEKENLNYLVPEIGASFNYTMDIQNPWWKPYI